MGMIFSQSEVDARKQREQMSKQIQPCTVNNQYIVSVKRLIQSYHRRIKELNKITDENNARFTDTYAEELNSQVKNEKNKAYTETRQSILDIYSRVRSLLARAAYADKSQFNESDKNYISSINLTASELQNIADGYQKTGNFTMLRWLRGYIKQFDGKDKSNPYNAVNIKMPEDILKVYKQYFDSALALVENAKEEKYTSDNPTEIESFADANFGNLGAVVGSGSDLEQFARKSVPDDAEHVFDCICLKDPATNQYTA